MAVLSTGCDQLFQVDQIEIVDSGRVDPPKLVVGNFIAHGDDGTLYPSILVPLAAPLAKGDLVVVAVCEIPSSPIVNVSDTVVTSYVHASADSATALPLLAAQLYYAVMPGAVTQPQIDVEFASLGTRSPDVRVAAYTNMDPGTPYENAIGESAESADSLSASVAVSAAPALLVAATCVGDRSTKVDGFVTRFVTEPNGDILADKVAEASGTVTATAHQGAASGLIVQLAAFRGGAAR
jgi:hypothetical protein